MIFPALFLRILRLLSNLSIDVCLSAVSTCLVLNYFAGNKPLSPPYVVCLILAVWSFYTYDHLSDARRSDSMHSRHQFHRNNQQLLWYLCLFSGFLSIIVAVLFLPMEVQILGFLFGCMVFLFLKFRNKIPKKISFLRELILLILFLAGCYLGPLSLFTGSVSGILWIIGFQICIYLQNIFVIGKLDAAEDKRSGSSNIYLKTGFKKGLLIIGLCSAISFLIFSILYLSRSEMNHLVLYFSYFIFSLLYILIFKKSIKNNTDVWRLLAEVIPAIPLGFLMLG